VVELKGGIKLARGGWEDYPGIRGRTDGPPAGQIARPKSVRLLVGIYEGLGLFGSN
jgi:hypothetical protein